MELAGAGHFTACHPVDTTTGRARSWSPTRPPIRRCGTLLGDLIAAFVAANVGSGGGAGLEELVADELVAHWDRR